METEAHMNATPILALILLLKTHACCQVDLPLCKLVGAFLRASIQSSVKLIK